MSISFRVLLAHAHQLPDDLAERFEAHYGRRMPDDVKTHLKRELFHKVWELLLSEEFIEGPLDLANTRRTLLSLLGSIMHGSSGMASNFKLLLQRIRLLNTDQRAYNIVFGLFQAQYYAFSQTMMAELSPPGFHQGFVK